MRKPIKVNWQLSIGTCEDHYQITNNVGSNTRSDISHPSKGQCPYYAHARSSSVFSSKDNRTVTLTRQDFLPDHTADGDLLFTFSSNILKKKSFVLFKNLARERKTHRDFIASRAASRPENLVPLALRTVFLMLNSCERSIVPSPVIFQPICAWFARVLDSNVWKT